MPIFAFLKPILTLKYKQNTYVGPPEPLQRKIIKRAVSRPSKFSKAL